MVAMLFCVINLIIFFASVEFVEKISHIVRSEMNWHLESRYA